MNRDIRINMIKAIVDDINKTHHHNVLVLGGVDAQWQRGNGSIKRADIEIATLSINIQSGGFLVGCDGVQRGINEYLKSTLPFNTKNSQNERYKCQDSEMRKVIEYYASIKI